MVRKQMRRWTDSCLISEECPRVYARNKRNKRKVRTSERAGMYISMYVCMYAFMYAQEQV
jgi:hypothetical protein